MEMVLLSSKERQVVILAELDREEMTKCGHA